MIGISPRQLEVFAAVASGGSVRAAARALHLTQPAVSMALAELERQLGAALFDRVRGRVVINAHGRELLPDALEVLQRLRDFQQQASARTDALRGDLRLGASNTVGNYRVGELLGGFVDAYPEVSVRLSVDNTEAIIGALLALEMDVACVEGPVNDARLETLAWRDDHLAVCVRTDHALARRRRLVPADFAGAHWIMRERGSATRRLSERALERLPQGHTVLEMGQVESIKQAVIAGLGIACLPAVAVTDAVAAGRLKVLHTPFLDLARRMSLVLHRARYRSAVVVAFVRSVEESRERLD